MKEEYNVDRTIVIVWSQTERSFLTPSFLLNPKGIKNYIRVKILRLRHEAQIVIF